MRISNVAGSPNTQGRFGVGFGVSITISPSLQARLRGAGEAAFNKKIERGLTKAGEYVLKSTDIQFATEGAEKLGTPWTPLSDRRIAEREAKLGGRAAIQRRTRTAFRSGRMPSAASMLPILDDTHRLRKSVTRRGDENIWQFSAHNGIYVLRIGSHVRGAKNHWGDMFSNLPQRKFFFLDSRDKREIGRIVRREAMSR